VEIQSGKDPKRKTRKKNVKEIIEYAPHTFNEKFMPEGPLFFFIQGMIGMNRILVVHGT